MKSHHKLLFFVLAFSAITFTACSDDAPDDDLTAPEMITDGANNVARTTCTVAGKYSGNLSKISEYGVKYSTSNNFPTDATTFVSFNGQPGTSVKAELANLSPNTHYYYCWYASTGKTVVTSAYSEFTTTSTSKPEFSEITVDSISENFMRLRCRVIEVGDQYLVEEGVSYRVKSNAAASFTPVTASSIGADNEFTVELNDLDAATAYEIRPYAKNSSDAEGNSGMLEGYGDTETISTENKVSPELETYDATDVTMNSARVLAMVTSAEGSYGVITERGFCYSSTSQNPTIYDKHVIVSGTTLNEVFETTLTDLDQLTTYYVRPYAKNLVDWKERVGYGTAIAFTTSRFSSPQVSFTSQDEVTVTSSSISLQAQIDNYYPTALVERGFIWSTDDKNISIDNAKSVGNYLTISTTDKVFSGTLNNLEPSTNYYIRAYAIYQSSGEALTGLSEVVSYTTNDIASGSFKDLTCTGKTTTTLSLTTGISDLGDGVFSEKGFCWRVGSGITVTLDNCDGSQVVQSEDNYNYSATLTGLQQATGYTVRGYVKSIYNWQTLVAYSDALYCETNDYVAATLKELTCTSRSISSLTVETGIDDLGNGTLEEKGFIWKYGNVGTPTLDSNDGSTIVTSTDNSSYSATISGLSYSTEYRIRGYVKTLIDGKSVTAYTNVITDNTLSPTASTFTLPTCTAQTTSSFTIQAGIGDLGDGDLTEKGICWRIADGVAPTLDNCDGSQVSPDTSTSGFTIIASNLRSGTTYSVRVYVKMMVNWETMIYYSDYITVNTNDFILATLKDITCTAQSISTLSMESGISDLGNGEFVEKGFLWRVGNSGTPTLENCDGSIIVDEVDRSSYSGTIKDLQAGTSYRLRAYTKTSLEGTTLVAYSDVITGTTKDRLTATMKSITTTLPADCTIKATSGISDLGTGELTEKGFCWKIGSLPTLEDCDGYVSVTNGTDEEYSASIDNLHYNTTYYVRAYAKTELEGESMIAYSSYSSMSTQSIDIAYTTSLGEDHIELSMYCNERYATQIAEWSAAIIMEGDTEISVNESSYSLASFDGTSNTYIVDFTGLKRSTTYTIRMRAKHKDGYYIYQDTGNITSLKGPSKEDRDNPTVKI